MIVLKMDERPKRRIDQKAGVLTFKYDEDRNKTRYDR